MALRIPKLKQQGKKDCGIAALRMVLEFYGDPKSYKEIRKKAGPFKSYGLKTIDLATVAQEFGYKTVCFGLYKKFAEGKADIKIPHPQIILKELKKKRPVIAAVNYSALNGLDINNEGHFIVVTEYTNGKIRYNDPSDGKSHTIPEQRFLFAWYTNAFVSSAYIVSMYK